MAAAGVLGGRHKRTFRQLIGFACPQWMSPAGRPIFSVSCIVLLHDGRSDAATLAHRKPVSLGPGTDLSALLTRHGALPTPTPAAGGRAGPAGVGHERRERVTQLLRVHVAQVNLIGRAVKREADGLAGLPA